MNVYLYVHDNPMSHVDPLGLADENDVEQVSSPVSAPPPQTYISALPPDKIRSADDSPESKPHLFEITAADDLTFHQFSNPESPFVQDYAYNTAGSFMAAGSTPFVSLPVAVLGITGTLGSPNLSTSDKLMTLAPIVMTAGLMKFDPILSQDANVAKALPNPGGRLGDALTRQTTANVINDMNNRGFTDISQEVLFQKGPLGFKNRFADVVGVNPRTGESLIINIGKQTQSGIPIMRERMALDDLIFSPTIQNYPNSRLLFIEKGASGLPPGL